MTRAYAVLTAAGAGKRLGNTLPKALIPLDGQPLVLRAARGLAHAGIAGIVITASPEAYDDFRAVFPENHVPGTDTQVHIVVGASQSRQASVGRGLAAISSLARTCGDELQDDTVILIHDAARCLTPTAVITRVITAVRQGYEAVIPAMPVTDTLKMVDRPSAADDVPRVVTATPERRCMVAIQTPQGFTWATIRRAHEYGAELSHNEMTAATDDAALVEAMGGTVHVVTGDLQAMKITTSIDLALAELILKQ
ncbi:IspD/TarI family cytidylyltransferase [Schaalia sp. lx-100]|uniref:IspD/TarI family cytidylyltransferase n=1 Tax=Schaalia sp. lx-100 TaxID=2899081 RepID=UPI001E3896F9|nr:2-C-methyl-D-erythritol 4-phosphate cytidylyltransferase [Schaalia sp. lx-100]MCD4557682.1 2-C-methyl-D-erythritol 4-phosphate cytidylyltransferase [Schaalia sp. lx-100]